MDEKQDLQIKLMSEPLVYYSAMLKDISHAKKSIYIEIYRFRNDPIGIRFRDYLIKKCKEGVRVQLLIDSWGAGSTPAFFQGLTLAGGQVVFFKKIRLSWDALTKNHRRDHRKIMVIDDDLTYIGSANIADYSLSWRESVFRIRGGIAQSFKRVVQENFKIYNKYLYDKQSYTKTIRFNGFEILRDVPSIPYQPVKKKFLELILLAKKEIVIETPYFLPGSNLRKALIAAAQRGVSVFIHIPKKSDVRVMDVLTSKYLGDLAQHGVRVLFYLPQNLHSKLFMVDRRFFVVGSSNFDYRSLRYQHEICLAGEHKSLARQLVNHFTETREDAEAFDFHMWSHRPAFQRFFEWLLVPFRHLF